MKLKFKTLTYQNILSVGNVPIVIDFDSAKKTLITGKNGGGKSTMIEALTYALFGKSFRDLKVGQLVNSINKKKCLVELLINTAMMNIKSSVDKSRKYLRSGRMAKNCRKIQPLVIISHSLNQC
ncbi:recombination endonuclease subunit [Klebsiella phage CPRSB]|nr:recombination endonuclease subunit [Klebsiella phage CPRSB]